MVRKKCALVACVRVCAQNISREEWFSVPSRTGHPPAHQQKMSVTKPKDQHFKIIVCVSLKNVIRLPTYQQKCYPSAYLPIKKCYPSAYLPTKKCYPYHFKKMLSCLPTQKNPSAYLHLKNVIRPPTCISKCYPSAYLPTKNVIRPPTYPKMSTYLHFKMCIN